MRAFRPSRRPVAASAALALAVAVAGCTVPPPEPREPSKGHISTQTPEPEPRAAIPSPVRRAPVVPPPAPGEPVETYTVVVNEVPVKELLFAIARDADLNVDVHPGIDGQVTLNAVDQTLDQILARISRQVSLRYDTQDDTLVIRPDTPFLRSYRVDYVNMARETTATNTVATQLATGGGEGAASIGANNSTTDVTSTSNHQFWETLATSVRAIILGDSYRPSGADGAPQSLEPDQVAIPNPEAGMLLVRATAGQHDEVRGFLDEYLVNAKRQVLVEATIVEVELSDRYRAGVDWQRFVQNAGIGFTQATIGGALTSAPAPMAALTLLYQDEPEGDPDRDLSITVQLLKQFGDVSVLSSPKLMVLNNQTATLKVVDNVVYFDTEAEQTVVSLAGGGTGVETTVDTDVRTVPVGLVMALTPQISRADEITMNVRPTITRVSRFVNDPQPDLAAAGVVNAIPEIAVREMESMLRLNSGQIAVLGGLMQDENRRESSGVPLLSEVPDIGELFKARDNQFTKTELVVFLRPWVVRTPSLEADLRDFDRYLPEHRDLAEPVPQGAPPQRPSTE